MLLFYCEENSLGGELKTTSSLNIWPLAGAGIFKLLRTPSIHSTESIPYDMWPFSVVIEQVTPHHCPLNIIYIRVLCGHCSIYSSYSSCVIDSILGSFSVPGINFSPFNLSKNLASALEMVVAWGWILGRNLDKVFKLTPPLTYFFKLREPLTYFYSSVTLHCKGERRKIW